MLNNLLLPKGYMAGLDEAALYAVVGYLVVFIGIAFLILVVWLIGKFMEIMKGKAKVKQVTPVAENKLERVPAPVQSEEVDEETVAVIMAALMAYYENNYPKCEFTVKRIKRVRRNDYA